MKSSKAQSKATSNPAPTTALELNPKPGNEDWPSHIAVSAYYKAESRGFSPGYELEDWLGAEAEEK